MRLLVDMNLTPRWVEFLRDHAFHAIHWINVGDPDATDAVVMGWARDHNCVVFTHDLDFSALLAMTRARGPSVLQVRTQDVSPEATGDLLVRVLRAHGDALEAGAVVTIEESAARVRILPIAGF